jgi:hypothetical protein
MQSNAVKEGRARAYTRWAGIVLFGRDITSTGEISVEKILVGWAARSGEKSSFRSWLESLWDVGGLKESSSSGKASIHAIGDTVRGGCVVSIYILRDGTSQHSRGDRDPATCNGINGRLFEYSRCCR